MKKIIKITEIVISVISYLINLLKNNSNQNGVNKKSE